MGNGFVIATKRIDFFKENLAIFCVKGGSDEYGQKNTVANSKIAVPFLLDMTRLHQFIIHNVYLTYTPKKSMSNSHCKAGADRLDFARPRFPASCVIPLGNAILEHRVPVLRSFRFHDQRFRGKKRRELEYHWQKRRNISYWEKTIVEFNFLNYTKEQYTFDHYIKVQGTQSLRFLSVDILLLILGAGMINFSKILLQFQANP